MYVYVCVCASSFFFIILYYKILNIVPCAIQQVLAAYFICSKMYLFISNS